MKRFSVPGFYNTLIFNVTGSEYFRGVDGKALDFIIYYFLLSARSRSPVIF
jgi:hypothetical protein